MNCIYTISFGSGDKSVDLITHDYMRRYADRIGADFCVVRDASSPEDKHSQLKLMLSCKWEIKELLKKYDRVLYLDSDILVLPTAKNVFEVVPEDCLSAFEEGHRYPNNLNCYYRYITEYNKVLVKNNLPKVRDVIGKYYNAGVFVASKGMDIFDDPEECVEVHPNWLDQNHFNMLINQYCPTKVKFFELPIEFNRMTVWADATLSKILNSSFIHYSITPNLTRLSLIKMHLAAHKRQFGEVVSVTNVNKITKET